MAATVKIFPTTQEKLDQLPKFKLPKTLAACSDLAYEIRAQRYALQKQVEELSKKESALADHLINNLPASDATGVRGKVAQCVIVPREEVAVTDWDAVHTYIIKNAKKEPGVWSLIQKRIGATAVKEMWARKKKMPGCEKIEVKTISLTKV